MAHPGGFGGHQQIERAPRAAVEPLIRRLVAADERRLEVDHRRDARDQLVGGGVVAQRAVLPRGEARLRAAAAAQLRGDRAPERRGGSRQQQSHAARRVSLSGSGWCCCVTRAAAAAAGGSRLG